MPFGLKNAGQCFQRNIHAKLASLPFVYCLMDDLIVASKSEEEHFMQMEKLLHTLNENNIVINMDKCVIAKPKVEFLGHIVSNKGITVPDYRIKAISEYPTPKSKKDLERFLGIIAFGNRFVSIDRITDHICQ